MQIERMTVALRPRNPWESMDLGVSLVRQQLPYLWRPWLLLMSVILLLGVLLINYHVGTLAWLLIWWLKPLYDRILLLVLSRRIFAEPSSLSSVIRSFPSLLKSGLLAALTYKRFDLARSFNLPVFQLEGIKAKERRQRIDVLQKLTRGKAVGLTTIAVHLELLVIITCYGLLYMMMPESVSDNFFDYSFYSYESSYPMILMLAFYVLAITVIEPLYLSAGFMLYLNRRTLLEAWDIELIFRTMAKRLQATPLRT